MLLLLTRVTDDVDEASEFVESAEVQWLVAQVQWLVARAHQERHEHPAAEDALIELNKMIKELRRLLVKEAEEAAGDAKDDDAFVEDDEAFVDDEEMETGTDHPGTVSPGAVSTKLAALEITDSKQATAVEPNVARALS